jgi:hypothetical protein
MNTMNIARRINDYAANRNARLAIQSTPRAAYEREGPIRMFFLKDMYEIAEEEMNLPEKTMNTKNQNQEIGDRNNRAAVAMRQQGDLQAAERFLQVAEYYWNLAAKAAREE